MPVLLWPFCSFCRIFLGFGLMVRTRSRPYGLCHCPYTKVYIKGFGSPYLHVCAHLLWCFTLVIGFAMLVSLNGFVVVQLHLTPMRPCLDANIRDASLRCWLLCAYLPPFPLHVMICSPCLFVPLVGFLCIRLLMCSCMSLACQCVVHTSTQWSYGHSIQTYICPSRTPPFVCRFAYLSSFCLLASLFAFLLSCLVVYLMARHVSYHMLCLPCISCLFASCLFHMLFASFISIACLLVSFLCLCMYIHGARMHGARARSPRHKQKGLRHKHVVISQATMFSRFKGLASPIWLCIF